MVYTTIEFIYRFLKAVAHQDTDVLALMLEMEHKNTKPITDMLINAMISSIECDLWDVYRLLNTHLPHLSSLAFLQSGVENYNKTFEFLLPQMPKEIIKATFDLVDGEKKLMLRKFKTLN
jgi:hypothetical protein